MKNKLDNLYSRIMYRLNGDDVESDNEIVSAFDVCNAVSDSLSFYNYLFCKNAKSFIKELNRSVDYTFVPFVRAFKIYDVKFNVNNDGEAFIHIFLDNGICIDVTGDKFKASINNHFLLSDNYIKRFLAINNDKIRVYLEFLNEFATKFPGVNMTFGQNSQNINDVIIQDDFMVCRVCVGNPESTQVLFSSFEDIELSFIHSKKYGKLYDYLVCYNKEFLKKMHVNVNDLNPFVRECVIKYLVKKDEEKLILEK